MGISPDDADKIAVEHRQAGLGAADTALLDFALKLALEPLEFGSQDLVPLRSHGFTDEQILEAVVMTSFTNFLNTLQFGLGAKADFPPRHVFAAGLCESCESFGGRTPSYRKECYELTLTQRQSPECKVAMSTHSKISSIAIAGVCTGPWWGSWETRRRLAMRCRIHS